MTELGMHWELILVDDGSDDGTDEVIRDLCEKDSRVKAVFLSRNFGHEVASTAGLDVARGAAAVLIDADLQDPPSVIIDLVEQWHKGYDVVTAQRKSRHGESTFKKGTAFIFYRLMNYLVRWHLPEDAGDFRLVSRAALDAFHQCRERNRFVRALVAWTGFRQTTVPFDRAPRRTGRTKYNARKLIALAATSIMSVSLIPLRLIMLLGFLIVLCTVGAAAIIAVRTAMGTPAPANAFLTTSIWFLGGLQCFVVGLVGEYVGRTYEESQNRPLYIVRERIGLDTKKEEWG